MKHSMRVSGFNAARTRAISSKESSRANTICEKPTASKNAAFSGVRMSHWVEA